MTVKEGVLLAMWEYQIPLPVSEILEFICSIDEDSNVIRSAVHARVNELCKIGVMQEMRYKLKTYKKHEKVYRLTDYGVEVVKALFEDKKPYSMIRKEML